MTEQGFEELRQLEPMVEVHRIQQAFDELTDIAQIFVENPYFSLAATSDIGPAMRRLELDTDLNIAELLAVKRSWKFLNLSGFLWKSGKCQS